MTFLNPLWLWASLAAVGVATPILIHLLSRQPGRVVDWAAMSLLRRAMAERSQEVRFEDRLLLLLRCAGLLLIALAMARPTLQGGVAGWLTGPKRMGVVIGVDVSYSMGYTEVRSRLDEAKRAVRRIASGLEPGEPISLVALGETPRVLLERVAYSETRLVKALGGLASEAAGLDVEAGLRSLGELAEATRAEARQCYIVSDGQRVSWSELSPDAAGSLRRLGEAATVRFIAIGDAGPANLAIERFEPVSGGIRQGTSAQYVATVRNGGEGPAEGASITLYRDDEPMERSLVPSLGPGAAADVPLRVQFDRPGTEVLEARLTPDGLPIDDARWAVADVRKTVDVLIVDGDPSPRRYGSETAFVVAALRPTPGGERGGSLRIEQTTADAWPARRHELGRFDVIIIANLGRIDPTLREPLVSWVRAGGGLLMFLGDRVTAPAFNRELASGRYAVSPARLKGVVAAPEDQAGWPVTPDAPTHRLGRMLRGLPGDLARTTRLRRYFRLQPVEGATVVWAVNDRAHPALVGHTLGRGRVLVFASTADRAWTDMPVFPVFPMMLHESVTHLTGSPHERSVGVGEAIELTLPVEPTTGEVRVEPPGLAAPIRVPVRFDRDVPMIRFAGAKTPGVHRVVYDAERPALPVAVNVDASEGDLRPLGPAALSVALGPTVEVVGDPSALAGLVGEARAGRELGRALLGLGLGLLLLEAWASRRFTKRAQVDADGVEVRSQSVAPARQPAA